MNRLIPAFLSILVVFVSQISAVQAQTLDAQQILDKAKQAAGGDAWDKVRTLYSKGKSKISGVDADRDEWIDLQRLRYAEKLHYGPISGGLGFDGKAAWGKEPNKPTVTMSSGDFYKGQITSTVLRSYAYWFPKRWETKTEYKGQQADGEKQFQVVQVSPKNGSPIELWFDSKTYLLSRMKGVGAKASLVYLSDYRDVSGVKIPFFLTQKKENGDVKLEEVQVNKLVTNEQYEAPPETSKSNKKG